MSDRNRSRRRALSHAATLPFANLEQLEARRLLAAQVVAPLVDRQVVEESAAFTVNLRPAFDDTAINGSIALFESTLGDIYVELFDTITPITVQNFISYINSDRYNDDAPVAFDSFIHRSVPDFVVQGGGFLWNGNNVDAVVTAAAIQNEFQNLRNFFGPNVPINARGTIAMAKLGGDPNSATSQWFFNVADNSAGAPMLDTQNGGFTTFGRVLFDGMDVVDDINALPRVNAGSPFDTLPVINFTPGNPIATENLVLMEDISIVGELTFTVVANSNPALVTVVNDGNGQLTITPRPNQAGFTDITVRATDLAGNSITDTFRVTVTNTNDQPTVASPIGAIDVNEDAGDTLINNLVGVFADVDIPSGDVLTFTITSNSNPNLVAAMIEGGGALRLDYAANQAGQSTITLRAIDSAGAFVEHTFTVTVDPVNDAPTVVSPIADINAAEDDGDRVIDLSAVFADLDLAAQGDALTFSVTSNTNASLLTASIVGSSLTLDFLANQSGTATVTVRARDSAGASVTDQFVVNVAPVNDAPVASDDVRFVLFGTPLVIDVAANDNDSDSVLNLQSVAIAQQPGHGQVAVDPFSGAITYTPAQGFSGTDTFTYTISDVQGAISQPATVTVNVTAAVSLGVFNPAAKLIINLDGVEVTFAISSAGNGEVFDLGGGLVAINIEGSTNASAASVATKNGDLMVSNITVDGSLKSFIGKTTDLKGSIQIAGTVGSIQLDDVADQHLITIGGPLTSKDTASFTFDQVADLTIDSDTPIKAITVTSWNDTDETPDRVIAPSVGTIDVKDKVAGRFQASLQLDGSDNAKQTLGKVAIPGSLSNTTWDITGDVGSVTIGGVITNWTLTASSDIGSLKLGPVVSATVNAGDGIGTIAAPRWAAGAIAADTLTTLTIKGTATAAPLFAAGLTLRGNAAVSNALNAVSIAGDLMNAVWNITGNVGGTTAGGTVSGLLLNVAGNLKSLSFGDVASATVTATGDVGAVTATRWLAGGVGGRTIKSLTTKGDSKNGIAGDFNAALTVTGAADAATPLGSAKIVGGAAGSMWNVNGSAGAVQLSGTIANWTFNLTGGAKSLTLGDVSNSSVLATGDLGAAKVVRWTDGQLRGRTLKSLTSTGNTKTSTPGDMRLDVALTGTGGDEVTLGSAKVAGRLRGGYWNVIGAAGTVTAGGVDQPFTFSCDRAWQGLTSSGDVAGTFTAVDINTFSVTGNLSNATILAGGYLGNDGLLGGGDDLFARGTLLTFKVTGNAAGTKVRVGVDPTDGILDNGNDLLLGSTGSLIKSLTIGGTGDTITFVAGQFPAKVSINRASIDPLTDARFSTTPL